MSTMDAIKSAGDLMIFYRATNPTGSGIRYVRSGTGKFVRSDRRVIRSSYNNLDGLVVKFLNFYFDRDGDGTGLDHYYACAKHKGEIEDYAYTYLTDALGYDEARADSLARTLAYEAENGLKRRIIDYSPEKGFYDDWNSTFDLSTSPSNRTRKTRPTKVDTGKCTECDLEFNLKGSNGMVTCPECGLEIPATVARNYAMGRDRFGDDED